MKRPNEPRDAPQVAQFRAQPRTVNTAVIGWRHHP
jgi:hypothetical protein